MAADGMRAAAVEYEVGLWDWDIFTGDPTRFMRLRGAVGAIGRSSR